MKIPIYCNSEYQSKSLHIKYVTNNSYAEKYAEGFCDIYFMRNTKKPDKSLVTVEVRHNKVVQSRIKNNKCPTDQQLQWLKIFEQNVLKVAA